MASCPTCTLLNADDALQCTACDALLNGAQVCPQCTLINAASACTCSCGTPLKKEEQWKCTVCDSTRPVLEAASQLVWLPCAHPGCVSCHKSWIDACDDLKKEPTCLTCDQENKKMPLGDDIIVAMLGAAAADARAARLLKRAGLVPCPTPDCGMQFELDAGVESRRTTCPVCRQAVQLGGISEFPAAGSSSSASGSTGGNGGGGDSSGSGGGALGTGAGTSADPVSLASDDEDGDAASSEEDEQPLAVRLPLRLPSGTKICPKCREGVEKADGCNKMECLCGCRFCWHCGALADQLGRLPCRCTGDEHTFWDNTKRKPAPKLRKRPRESVAGDRV